MRDVEAALAARDTPLEIFFRNDDAGWAQEALDPLLDIFASQGHPIDLAVIPAALDDVGAQRLNTWRTDHPGIGLHQHGYAHLNHEHEGARKCEFGPSRSHDRQIADIVSGRMRMVSMLDSCDPIFTPPWNRCSSNTAEALVKLGFKVISDDGALTKGGSAAPCLPVSFDWERHRRSGSLIPELALNVSKANAPLGIMLHHETMDASARDTLAEFLALLNVGSQVHVYPMRHFLGSEI
jgi:predicted deacetylase